MGKISRTNNTREMERVKNGPEYVEAIIPFMCEIVEGRSKEIEKATGIKEIEYSHVLKLNYENKEPIILRKTIGFTYMIRNIEFKKRRKRYLTNGSIRLPNQERFTNVTLNTWFS